MDLFNPSSLLNAFLFFLPAGMANAAPVLANKIPGWNQWQTPLDFGRHWRGQRIFGENKRWRGLVSGTILGGLVAGVESTLAYHVLDGDRGWFVLAGMLMGFGALAGDAIESFFKRQLGVRPGDSWFPFDQLDYIIGGLLAVSPFIQWSLRLVLQVIMIYFVLHLVISYLAFRVGLKTKPI